MKGVKTMPTLRSKVRDESDAHERSSSYPNEGSDEGNTRKKILQEGKG